MATLERGFKSFSERTATSLRKELGVEPHAPLEAVRLAGYLGVRLLEPRQIPGLPSDVTHQLLEVDRWGWSAVTLLLGEEILVIYNPKKSKGRRASDVMHELAHVVLNHEPTTLLLSQDGAVAMRTFNPKQEDEANWLSWCLLLPREALMHARRARLTNSQIAEHYGVSQVLVDFRLRMSGIDLQLSRWRRR